MPAERSSAKKKAKKAASKKSTRTTGSGSRTTAATKKAAKKTAAKKKTARKKTAKKAASSKAASKKKTTKKAVAKKAAKKVVKKTAKKAAATKKAAAKKASSSKRTTKRATKAGTAKQQDADETFEAEITPKATNRTRATKRANASAQASGDATTTTATMDETAAATAGEPAAALPSQDEETATSAAELLATEGTDEGTEPEEGLPADPMAEVTTEELWEQYRTESTRLLQEIADELGVAIDAPEVTSKKRGLTSPVLEDLRNELIERHYPLVRYIAERLLQTLPKSIELDDLISAGQFGLMDAIRGFDPDRGIKFKTYCSTRIRGSILDQLRSQDWVPRLVRIKWGRIERALQQLTGEFGREPTHAELAKVLGMSHDELSIELGQAQAKAMFSLSEKWDDDEDGSVEKVEILQDDDSIDPVHELNRRDLMKFITRALTHKERFIIEQYYQYGHTMREIGEMLALTESRVCQIHSNVMGRLKGLLAKRESSLES